MQTTTPGSSLILTAMYDESGNVAGCSLDGKDGRAWACHFCMWEDCLMRGKKKGESESV
jgi:hypothetical protein